MTLFPTMAQYKSVQMKKFVIFWRGFLFLIALSLILLPSESPTKKETIGDAQLNDKPFSNMFFVSSTFYQTSFTISDSESNLISWPDVQRSRKFWEPEFKCIEGIKNRGRIRRRADWTPGWDSGSVTAWYKILHDRRSGQREYGH